MNPESLADSLRESAAAIAESMDSRPKTDRRTPPARRYDGGEPGPAERRTEYAPHVTTPNPLLTEGLLLRLTDGDPNAVVTVAEHAVGGPVAVVTIPVAGCVVTTDSRRIGSWGARCECGWITGMHRSLVARKYAMIHSARCRIARDVHRQRSGR